MINYIKVLFLLTLILLSIGCKKKKLKVIKIPTGENVYFTDDSNPGDADNFEDNLKATFTKQDTGHFTYEAYHYLTIDNVFEYIDINGISTTGIAIKDKFLNITYIYDKAKLEEDGVTESKGDGLFIVVTNETPTPPVDPTSVTHPTPPIITDMNVYVGISIKSKGRSLYITDIYEKSKLAEMDWSYTIITDSRERSLEDMWLKNAQDNRVEVLTMENSGRIIRDNYLMVYTYQSAITPSRAVYKGFNTAYYIGIELERAGKEIYLSYDAADITSGTLSTSVEEIDWSDMSFVGYTTRIEGPITTMPSSLRAYDTFEPEYD